jgi:hypothetical protein
VLRIIQASNPNKATGLDEVAIATWQAGGEAAAVLATDVLNSSRMQCKAPVKIKGGRIQDVYKGKGDKKVTANSRGLLIQPYLGKLHGGLLKNLAEPTYRNAIPDTQCGATGGKNAGMASLTTELHADLARSRKLSSGRLFVDLQAAFDSIVREIAFLRPDESPSAVDDLINLHKFLNELGVILKRPSPQVMAECCCKLVRTLLYMKCYMTCTIKIGSQCHGLTHFKATLSYMRRLGQGKDALLAPCFSTSCMSSS